MLPQLSSVFPNFRPPSAVSDSVPNANGAWMFKRQNSSEAQHTNAKKLRCTDADYGNGGPSIEEASSSIDVFNLLLRKQSGKDSINGENGDNGVCDTGSADMEKRDITASGRRNGTSGWLIPPLMQLSMPIGGGGAESGGSSGDQRHFSADMDSDSRGTHSPPNIVNGSSEPTTPQLSPMNLTMPSHMKSLIGPNGLPLLASFLPRFGVDPAVSPPECIPLSVSMPGEHAGSNGSRASAVPPMSSQQMASIASSLQQLPSLATLFSSRFAADSPSMLNPLAAAASFGQRQPVSGDGASDQNPSAAATRPPLPFAMTQSAASSQMGGSFPHQQPAMGGQASAALLQQIQAAIRSRRREKVNGRHFCTFPGCAENYASIEHIQDHELQHTVPDGKYLPCPVPGCRERFKWRNYLRVHMKRCHSSIIPPPLDIASVLPPVHSSPPKQPTPHQQLPTPPSMAQFTPNTTIKTEKEVVMDAVRNALVSAAMSKPPYGECDSASTVPLSPYRLPSMDPRLGVSMLSTMESPRGRDSFGANGGVRPQGESGVGPSEPTPIGSPTVAPGHGDGPHHSAAEDDVKTHTSDLAKMMSMGLAAIPADVRAALDGMMQLVPSSYVSRDDGITQ